MKLRFFNASLIIAAVFTGCSSLKQNTRGINSSTSAQSQEQTAQASENAGTSGSPDTSNPTDDTSSPPSDSTLDPIARKDVVVRTFEQYNKTLSQLTGIATSQSAIMSTYNQVQNQLPSTNDYTGFSAFNVVGMSALAFEYCSQYVDAKPELPKMTADGFATYMITNILGNPTDVKGSADLKQGMLDIMAKTDLVNPTDSKGFLEREKLACTAFLASAYVSLL